MKTLKPIFCVVLLLLGLLKSYSQEHPFLIVKENQYPALRAKWKTNKRPFKPMKDRAFERWNNAYENNNFGSMSTALNYNILAYILEENTSNRIKYKNRMFEILKAWERGTDFLSGNHGRFTGGASMQFNAIVALDIIYNDLTSSQRIAAEKGIIKANNFYKNNSSSWTLVDYGIKLVYAIFKKDAKEIAKWKGKYDNYLFDKSMMKDGSWGQSSGYVFARMHGDRLAKNFPIDILHFTGQGNYYNDSRLKALFEWSNTFAVTPSGSTTKFGDTGHNSFRLNKSTNWYFAEKYGATNGGMARWNMGPNNYPPSYVHSNYLIYILKSVNPPTPVMPVSKLREHSGAALWDKTNSREALQGVLHCLKRDNPSVNQFGHTLEESNTFDLSGYGQHMIMNSGVNYVGLNGQGGNYPGYAPDNGRWSRAILHNTVLIGNKTKHDQRDGNGLIDGLVGGNIEFGTTDAGLAIKNGTHKRTLSLIHPIVGKSNGYFVIYDEVKPTKSSDKVTINFQVNTKRGGTNTIKTNQEYVAPITAAVYKDFNSHDTTEKVNLFFASSPQVAIVDSYKGGFDITDVKSDNVRAQYNTGADGFVRATTIVFPEDKTHKKPPISKISNVNYSGAIVSHSTNFKDYYIGASPSKTNTYSNISFKANTTFFRKESGKTTKFSSTNGTSFRDTQGVDYGYQASQQVSIVLENNSGHIYARKNSNVTFYKQNITGVKINGTNTTVISSASNAVTITIPTGRHKIELIINGTPPVITPRPAANLANGDYFIENPTGGARIKNTNGASISVTNGSGNDVKWTLTKINGSNSNYTLKNVQTGRYLEVPYGACNAGDNTQNPNVNLGTYTQVVADHLRWNITKVGNDYFLQPLHCEKVADRNNGKKMHLWPYQAGNKNQNWKIVSVNKPINKPPTLSFLRPTSTAFEVGDNLTVEAKANDVDGLITKVELFFDGNIVRKSPQSNTHIWWSKYDALMTNLEQGSHTLKIVATDDLGATTEVFKTIFVGNTTNCSWIKQSGKANDIGANGSHVYLIGTNGYLYRSNGNGEWINTDRSKKLKRLDVAPNGDVWAIGEDNKLWQYKYPNGPWLDKNGTGIDIGVGNNVYYILGLDNRIKKYTGNGTYDTLSSGTGKRIDIDGNGNPWIVGMNNGLYKWNGSSWNRKGSLTILDVGIKPNGDQVMVTSTDQKVYLYLDNGEFTELPGKATQVTTNSDHISWIINNNNDIYKQNCDSNIDPNKDIDITNTITIYPNPVHDDGFTIYLGDFGVSRISILDAQGKVIYKTQTDKKSIEIEHALLKNSGLFFVKVVQNKQLLVKKILLK